MAHDTCVSFIFTRAMWASRLLLADCAVVRKRRACSSRDLKLKPQASYTLWPICFIVALVQQFAQWPDHWPGRDSGCDRQVR